MRVRMAMHSLVTCWDMLAGSGQSNEPMRKEKKKMKERSQKADERKKKRGEERSCTTEREHEHDPRSKQL